VSTSLKYWCHGLRFRDVIMIRSKTTFQMRKSRTNDGRTGM